MNLTKEQKQVLFYALLLHEAGQKIGGKDLAMVNRIVDKIVKNDNGCRELLISSRDGLGAETMSKLKTKLDTASLSFEKDDDILGGIKIKNCSVLIDASVNSLLDSLKDKLEAGS